MPASLTHTGSRGLPVCLCWAFSYSQRIRIYMAVLTCMYVWLYPLHVCVWWHLILSRKVIAHASSVSCKNNGPLWFTIKRLFSSKWFYAHSHTHMHAVHTCMRAVHTHPHHTPHLCLTGLTMALDTCKPGTKKESILASYQQSFRIDDLLRQKAIDQQQQPDHFTLTHTSADSTFRMGPVPQPKTLKSEVAITTHKKFKTAVTFSLEIALSIAH